MIPGNKFHSIANPALGSASATRGIKSISNFVTYSIGTISGSPTGYLDTPAGGEDVTASIKNGVITFSHPQTNAYVGIGDKVDAVGFDVYLNEKISTSQWRVKYSNGQVPDNIDDSVIISINKVFPDLFSATDPAGASVLLGTDDLVAAGVSLRLACYALNEVAPTGEIIDISSWTTDKQNYVHILSPKSVKTECNYPQFHNGIFANGYSFQADTGYKCMNIECPYTVIEGLDLVGVSNDIIYVSPLAESCLISGNIIRTTSSGKGIGLYANKCKVVNNIVYFSDIGIYTDNTASECLVYNNTVYGGNTCLQETGTPAVRPIFINNLTQFGLTTCIDLPDNTYLYNCISSDGSSSTGTDCHALSIRFKDASALNLLLGQNSQNEAVRLGMDLSGDSVLPVVSDILGNPMDSTWSIGAHHFTRILHIAIGDPSSTDVKTGTPNASIVEGKLTFDAAQTDDRMCAGFIVDLAGDEYVLYERISNTEWMVVKSGADAGYGLYNKLSTAVTSIKPAYSNLYEALEDAGSGTSGIEDSLNSEPDLTVADVKVVVNCSFSSAPSVDISMDPGLIADQTRTITIRTPYEDTESNSRRRHSGTFNTSLWYLDGSELISSTCASLIIEGLQIRSTEVGISLMPGGNFRITDNIIEGDGGFSGIYIGTGAVNTGSLIANNIVYGFSDEGIRINHMAGNDRPSYFFVYNNTVYGCGTGVFIEVRDDISAKNFYYLKNNLVQNCSEACYFSDKGPSSSIEAKYNYSSDITITRFGLTNYPSFNATFKDKLEDNFIPVLSDMFRTSLALNLSADPSFPLLEDAAGNTRGIVTFGAGALIWVAPAKVAAFSVGQNLSDLSPGGLSVTIADGILTFDADPGPYVGVGDVVTYDGATKTCYLAEKGDSFNWHVVDETGSAVLPCSSLAVDHVKRVENNLVTMISGPTGGTAASLLGTMDIATALTPLNIYCYNDGTPDTETISIEGWTTSPAYGINIEAPYSEITQSNSSNRHSGTWLSSGFLMEIATGTVCISIDIDNVKIEGLKLKPISNSENAITVLGAHTGIVVTACIIRDSATGINQAGAGYLSISSTLIYDCTTGINIQVGDCYGNTVIESTTGINSGAASRVYNCLAQANTTDFTGTGSLMNCISEDTSAGTSNGCRSNAVMMFLDAGSEDFHLHRSDWMAIRSGLDLHYDANFHVHRDIDSEEIVDGFSIGADSFEFLETIDLVFSVGESTSNLMVESPTITISGGVAELLAYDTDGDLVDQDNQFMGVGDVIVYDGSLRTCYLKRRIDGRHWEVVDRFGYPMKDQIIALDVDSISHAFNDMAAAINASPGGVQLLVGSAANPFTELSNPKYRLNLSVYKSSANIENKVEITGFSTDEDHYIRIYTPTDIVNECNSNQRHIGKLDLTYNAKFYLGADETEFFLVNTPYTEIDGIILTSRDDTHAGSNNGIVLGSSGSDCKISNCIIYDCYDGIDSSASNQAKLINNIIYRCNNNGINTSGDDVLINNTVAYSDNIGINNSASDMVVNCLVSDSTTNGFNDNTNIEYCISSDASAGSANNCISSVFIQFINPLIGDFHLSNYETNARGGARNFASHVEYAFDIDAENKARGRFWDCGALEFEAKKACFSVGNVSDMAVRTSGLLEYIIQTVDEHSIITFSEPQTNENMGMGDALFDFEVPFQYGCTLIRKIDDIRWVVADYRGENIIPRGGFVGGIYRAMASLSSALSDGVFGIWSSTFLGSKNLAAFSVQPTIACYDDYTGADTIVSTEIPELISDVDSFLRITTPKGGSESNVSHAHTGKAGSGYTIEISSGGSIVRKAIHALKADYIELIGLSITVNGLGSAIVIEQSKNVFIANNIIHDMSGRGIDVDMQPGSVDVIVNNLVYNCGDRGISCGSETNSAAAEACVFNNTVVNCLNGILCRKPSANDDMVFHVYNNLVQDSAGTDFSSDYALGSTSMDMKNNLSEDETADLFGGSGNISNIAVLFSDRDGGIFELSTMVDSVAKDSAFDLSLDTLSPFNNDIIYKVREPGLWDIGAFESAIIEGDEGDCILDIQSLSIDAITSASVVPPTLELHLRSSGPAIGEPTHNFATVGLLNAWLSANESFQTAQNIIVYVQGDTVFTGTFEFGSRIDKTVTVKTYPAEMINGPASIIYDGTVVDDASAQETLIFENIKVYSDNTMSAPYVFGDNADTTAVEFINCIVQLNNDAFIGPSFAASCTISAINSVLVYRNTGSSATLYLTAKDTSGNYIANTSIVTYLVTNVAFKINNGAGLETIINCLGYNYGNGDFSFDDDTLVDCIIDEDPLFREAELNSQLFDNEITMSSLFSLELTSPAVDAGDNAVVLNPPGIPADILGRNRIFDSKIVDIGPYEEPVTKLVFDSQEIRSIFTSKLRLEYGNKSYAQVGGDQVFFDLYQQFSLNPSYRDEFVRESKIIMQIRGTQNDYIVFSDKPDKFVCSFEAYYDLGTRSIVISKTSNENGKLLSDMFDDSRYIFKFDEATHSLSVYLNNTYDKGMSGSKNIVNSMRYGGQSIASV